MSSFPPYNTGIKFEEIKLTHVNGEHWARGAGISESPALRPTLYTLRNYKGCKVLQMLV